MTVLGRFATDLEKDIEKALEKNKGLITYRGKDFRILSSHFSPNEWTANVTHKLNSYTIHLTITDKGMLPKAIIHDPQYGDMVFHQQDWNKFIDLTGDHDTVWVTRQTLEVLFLMADKEFHKR